MGMDGPGSRLSNHAVEVATLALFFLLVTSIPVTSFSQAAAPQPIHPRLLVQGAGVSDPAGHHAVSPPDPYPVNLPPDYYIPFNVSNAYAGAIQLKFSVTSNVQVNVYVMDTGEFSDFVSGISASGIYSATGTDVTYALSLQPETAYYLVVWNGVSGVTADTEIAFNTNPVDIFSFYHGLPAPIGVSDYGVVNSPRGATSYTELNDGVTGTADMNSIGAYNATAPQGLDPDGASLQLNANLQINTTKGQYTYWLQNVVSFRTSAHLLYFQSEIFNFSAFNANLTNPGISGNGVIYSAPDSQNTYIFFTHNYSYSLPLNLQLPIIISQSSSSVVVKFGFEVSNNGSAVHGSTVYYDAVTFSGAGSVESSGILIDGSKMSPEGLFDNAELVFCGEGNGEATTYTQMNSALSLSYSSANGTVTEPKALWEFGSDTGESSYNLQTSYAGGLIEVGLGMGGFNENYLLPPLIPLKLSYEVRGGLPSTFSPPVLTYISDGIAKSANLTATPTVYHVDNGTDWNVASSFPNSSTERWAPTGSTSGETVAAANASLVYHHQYNVTLGYTGGGGQPPPSVTYEQLGQQSETQAGSSVWADSGSSYSYPTTLSGSTSTERWYSASPAGKISSAGAINEPYFHQYAFNADYTVQGGAAPGAPVIAYEYLGTPTVSTLSTSGSSIWIDAGASWSVTNPLSGSSATERWSTSSASSGTVTGSITFSPVYYHQFLIVASYSVLGGGSPSEPDLSSASYGSPVSLPLSQTVTSSWLDAGASWSLTNPLTSSGSSERWISMTNESGSIGGSMTIQASYYHQFLTEAAYSVMGGGSPSSPVLNSKSFGAALSTELTLTARGIWLDAGAPWSIANPLGGSTGTERWYTASPSSGTIASPTGINSTFYHQFLVFVSGPAQGGTVLNSTGWHDAGSSVSVSASANQGWRFEGWVGTGAGSYSGNQSAANFYVASATNETATFYPGLTLESTGGSISYSYGSTSGSVQGSQTVFAPYGVNISLSASPSSFFSAFSSWSGAISGSSSKADLALTTPSSVTATFGYDYVKIFAVVGVAVVVALAATFMVLRRRSRSSPTERAPAEEWEDAWRKSSEEPPN